MLLIVPKKKKNTNLSSITNLVFKNLLSDSKFPIQFIHFISQLELEQRIHNEIYIFCPLINICTVKLNLFCISFSGDIHGTVGTLCIKLLIILHILN